MKRGIYIGVLFSALIVLALGGWAVKGLKKATSPAPRPRSSSRTSFTLLPARSAPSWAFTRGRLTFCAHGRDTGRR